MYKIVIETEISIYDSIDANFWNTKYTKYTQGKITESYGVVFSLTKGNI